MPGKEGQSGLETHQEGHFQSNPCMTTLLVDAPFVETSITIDHFLLLCTKVQELWAVLFTIFFQLGSPLFY